MADVTVTLALTAEQAASGTSQVSGVLHFRPTARRVVDSEVVLPAPFTQVLTAGDTAPTVVLTKDDGLTWAWQVLEAQMVDGRGAWTTFTVSDQDDDATVDYCDLTEVDADSLEPVSSAGETVAESLAARPTMTVDTEAGTITFGDVA